VSKEYRKIDIYVNGKYVASTKWAKSLKEAKTKFIKQYVGVQGIKSVFKSVDILFMDIKAVYSK